MKTDFLPIENQQRFTWWQKAAMLMLVMMASTTLWATDFIIDIKLIGGGKSKVQEEINSYKSKGWILVDQDLNSGCGAASDYIYLIYKTASSDTEGVSFITDFYLSDSDSDPNLGKHDTKNPPNYFTDKNGREYVLSGYRGSDHFTSSVHGNLNSNTSGDNIYLYYTKAKVPDRRGVTSVYFNDKTSGAVGKNGGSSAYDVNAGAGGDRGGTPGPGENGILARHGDLCGASRGTSLERGEKILRADSKPKGSQQSYQRGISTGTKAFGCKKKLTGSLLRTKLDGRVRIVL